MFKLSSPRPIRHAASSLFAMLLSGAAALPFASPDWSFEGTQEIENTGRSVSSAGDVNGDGYDDVIVGVPWRDTTNSDAGRAYVFYGGENGIAATPAWTADCANEEALYGLSVASAGDVNHDTYDDVIVGAHYYSSGESKEGKAFVYYGSASGLSETPDWAIESDITYCYYAYDVASAGDVNNDGCDDVIVGALGYDNGYPYNNPTVYYNEGAAFVYLGAEDGLTTSPAWVAGPDRSYSYFGRDVETAGDVNGDGFDDVIVGAYAYMADYSTVVGAAFLYYGSATGLPGVFTGYHTENGSGGPVDPDWEFYGTQKNSRVGSCVASAGDLNGDTYDDIVVSSFRYDNTETDEGVVYVFYGSEDGPTTSPCWTAYGGVESAQFGYSAASGGDLNGDGFDDLIVSAPYYPDTTAKYGAIAVYFGSATGLSSSATTLATADWLIVGEDATAVAGLSVASAGDVNKDGFDDIVIGAPGYDISTTGGEGKALAFYGSATVPVQLSAFDIE